MKRPITLTSTIRALTSVVGICMILTSIGARFLGIDQDAGWGPARTFLLGCGILFAIAPYIFVLTRFFWTRLYALIPSSWLLQWRASSYRSNLNRRLERLINSPQSLDDAQRKKKIVTYISITFLLTILVFTWIISVGRWFDWPDTTNYFHLQSQAFLSGQLHLLVEPSEQILQLSDPYPYANRANSPYLWDASLYDGKYFLYWGPTPAVITAFLETMLQAEIGDQQLVFIFTLGAIGFGFLIIRLIWNRYFPTLAAWTVLPAVFLIGLANPTPWLLGRPAVYEAAIASGQLFFMGGLYWFLLGQRRLRRGSLYDGISGFFFVAALGSRITLLPGIIVLGFVVMILEFIGYSDFPRRRVDFRQYLPLIIPILIGLVFLGWYNYARFENIFEFGHRYQLTSWGMASAYKKFFSWRNIVPNLYNYFLNGYRTLPVFPFIKPLWGVAGVPPLKAFAVGNYHAEQVAGILITSPIILVGFLPVLLAFRTVWTWLDEPTRNIQDLIARFFTFEAKSIYAGMLVLTLSLILPLSFISFNSMRYLFDFSLAANLTCALGIGLIFVSKELSSFFKAFIALLLITLSLYSSVVGILLGITSYAMRFEHLNPSLFDLLTRFFAF